MTTATELRNRGAARLRAAGVDSAAADAGWLLAHTLGTDPGRLLLIDDVDDDVARNYDDLISRRAQRIPLQHLTGTADFAGVTLAVGPGVFVPRPETEYLVEWAEKQAAGRDGDLRIADLCSGSGALGIALAARLPQATVTVVERSTEAAAYLRRNIDAQPAEVARRVQLVVGDVTDPGIMAQIGDCDLIVSNPPYVPAGADVSTEVTHDPADAVYSGDTGMDLISAMVPLIADHLAGGGAVAVEHDDTTGSATARVFAATGRFTRITEHCDLAGRPRFVSAQLSDPD